MILGSLVVLCNDLMPIGLMTVDDEIHVRSVTIVTQI